ncbi:hypothetical protein [Pseudoteredinibacter isoporae]|uniref:hypothetical protein n=1 Tax=Pseudoteredinibacter isoporae TaxID=570281 RepID=UPI00310AFE96
MTNYVTWGIVIGSIIGLFAGIFWFEMGLSMLAGVSLGILVSTALATFRGKRSSA